MPDTIVFSEAVSGLILSATWLLPNYSTLLLVLILIIFVICWICKRLICILTYMRRAPQTGRVKRGSGNIDRLITH